LLCTLPCQSEEELLGKFPTNREHYLHLNPNIESTIEISSSSYKAQIQNQFHSFITNLLNELSFIKNQTLPEYCTPKLNL